MDIRDMEADLAISKADAERQLKGQRTARRYYLYKGRHGVESLRTMPLQDTITQTRLDPTMPGQVAQVYADKSVKTGEGADVRELFGAEIAEQAQRFFDKAKAQYEAEEKAADEAEAKGEKHAKGSRSRRARVAAH